MLTKNYIGILGILVVALSFSMPTMVAGAACNCWVDTFTCEKYDDCTGDPWDPGKYIKTGYEQHWGTCQSISNSGLSCSSTTVDDFLCVAHHKYSDSDCDTLIGWYNIWLLNHTVACISCGSDMCP